MTAVVFRKKALGEPLAQYLHDMAELFGADREQRRLLAQAAAMSYPTRPKVEQAVARRIAARVQAELQAGIDAVVYEAQARGESVSPFNDDGAVVLKGRDGLYSLFLSGGLTERLFNTGIAYRALVEACGHADVGSQLGRLTGQPSAPRTSTKGLHLSRLNGVLASVQLDAAEAAAGPDHLAVLRAVAGEGRTIGSMSNSGHRRKVLLADLIVALERVRISLAETGGLRITGS